jgi:hypothetical protein
MPSNNTIQYLTRREIDTAKWNQCINEAPNGLIYAQTCYLDVMCTNWHALVMNDYEAVMPLPWRKKWGFYYLYQPYFIPALGVFGNDSHTSATELFLNRIPKRFRYWEIDLNEKSAIKKSIDLTIKNRTNLFLPLNQSYEAIFKNYKRLAKRKLHIARENGLIVHTDVNAKVIIQCYEKNYEEKKRLIPHEMYTHLFQAITLLSPKNYKTYLVKKNEVIVAFYLILSDEKYLYSLLGGSTGEGKKLGAFYLATDAAIKDFAGTGKIFRFEGSDIEGIAFFNRQFGSAPVNYLHIKKNQLPWPFYYFK